MTHVRMRRTTLAATALATLLTGAVAAAGPASAADTTAPNVTSLTVVGSSTADATNGPATVTLRLRITDAGGNFDHGWVEGFYARDASAHPDSAQSGLHGASNWVERVSGTAADGIYEGRFQVFGGTRGVWNLAVNLYDTENNYTYVTNSQLAAKGAVTSVKSATTRVPATPRLTAKVQYPGTWQPSIIGTVTLTQPAGTPAPSSNVVVSAGAPCGTALPVTYPGNSNVLPELRSFKDKWLLVNCTTTLRAVNAAGVSPSATISFR